jgi:hypothetical protein
MVNRAAWNIEARKTRMTHPDGASLARKFDLGEISTAATRMKIEAAAEILGISEATAKRWWAFCSMKITEDVPKYVAEQGIVEEEALKKEWDNNPASSRKKTASFTRSLDSF